MADPNSTVAEQNVTEANGNTNTNIADLVEYISQDEPQRIISILEQQPNLRKHKNFNNIVKVAIDKGNEGIVIWLLEHGVSKNAALDVAINNYNEKFVDLIIDQGADVDEGIYFAVKTNKTNLVAQLLARGANINTNKRNGNTPLHVAIIQKCDLNMIQFLIDNGADTNIRTKNNKTALDLVAKLKKTNDELTKKKLEKIEDLLKQNKISDNMFECLQGLPDGLSGYSYQVKLFTLYAIINTKVAKSAKCQYQLGTELKGLLPFDDIYLRKTHNGLTSCEFVQVKQTKKPESNKLDQSSFFTSLKSGKNMKEYVKGNDTIVKMLLKFEEILESHLESGSIGDFMYCTNTNFKIPLNAFFARADDKGGLLCGVGGQKWRIEDWRYLLFEIKFVLLNLIASFQYSKIDEDLKRQVESQIQVINGIKIDEIIKKADDDSLWSIVKIASEGANAIDNHLDYLDKCKAKLKTANDVDSITKCFPDEYELPRYSDDITAFKTSAVNKISEIHKSVKNDKDIYLQFCKWDDNKVVIKNKLQNFVKHFSIYTNCPTSDELDEIITKEISEEFKFHKYKLLSCYCVQYFNKWISDFKNERGNLFKDEDGIKLFHDLRVQILKGFTKLYMEDLQLNNLRFKNNEEILQFLNDINNRTLHVITQHARLHAIKIFQTIKDIETQMDFSLDNVLFTNSELIFKSNDTVDTFLNAFSSDVNNNLLVIEFSDAFKEMGNIYEILDKLRNIMAGNDKKKLIVIAEKENSLATPLKYMFKGSKSCQESIGFNDLDNNSQDSILNKTVDFQNYPKSSRTDIKIKDFLSPSAACEIIDEELLYILTKNECIQIGGRGAFHSEQYNKVYYIPRYIHHQIVDCSVLRNADKYLFLVTGILTRQLVSQVNRPDISIHFWEEGKTFDVGIIVVPDNDTSKTNEEIFTMISNISKKNVFWLEFKEDIFFWKGMKTNADIVTNGHLETTEMSQTSLEKYSLPPENIVQKVVICANNPGEGKSTMLTYLAHTLRKKSPYLWLIRVNLRNHADNTLPIGLNNIKFSHDDTAKAVEFLTLISIHDNPNAKLERKLLAAAMENNSKIAVVLLFDGFDEISPGYKEKTSIWMKALIRSKVKQLWVTTRVHMKEYLEEQLQVPVCMMTAFTEEEQVELLNQLWKWNLINYKVSPNETSEKIIAAGILDQLKICYENYFKYDEAMCKTELKKISKFSLQDVQKFISNNINFIDFAKASLKTWELSIIRGEDFLKIPLNLEMLAKNIFQTKWKIESGNIRLFEIYNQFVENKINIYKHVKSISESGNQASKEQADVAAVTYRKMHREVAVKTLFTASRFLPELNISREYANANEKLIRIGLVRSYGSRVEFVHCSYAEYFFAEYLSIHVEDPYVQSELLTQILISDEYNLVRTFLDGFFARNQSLEASTDQIDGTNYFSLKNVITPQVKKLIVTGNNKDNENVLHLAAREGHAHIFTFILNNIDSEDFGKLILENASEDHSVLHLATLNGHNELFKIIMNSVKDVPQIQKNLIMKCDKHGNTCLHLATILDRREICKIVLHSIQIHDDIFKEFVTKKNIRGLTAVHLTFRGGRTEVFDLISEALKEDQNLFTDIISKCREVVDNFCDIGTMTSNWHIVENSMFLATTERCKNFFKDFMTLYSQHSLTTLDVARLYGRGEDAIMNPAERYSAFNDIIVKCDHKQRSALHIAAETGDSDVCEVIMKTASKFSVLDDLLMRCDFLKRTALHIAAMNGNSNVCVAILRTASECSIFRDLMLKGNCTNATALHLAAENGSSDSCNVLLDFAKRYSVLKDLLMRRNVVSRTALHLAVEEGSVEACSTIIKAAENHPMFKDFISSSDFESLTVLHIAAENGDHDICTMLLTVLEKHSILSEMMMKLARNDGTPLHLAAHFGRAEACNLIMKVAKRHSIFNKLVMKTDGDDLTALQVAAENGKREACEAILKTAKKYSAFEDVIMRCNCKGRTVLHIAADNNEPEVCDLIMNIAKKYLVFEELIMKCDCKNLTALHLAAENGNVKVCEILMKTAKKYSVLNELLLKNVSHSGSVLHVAAENGHGNVCDVVMNTAKKYGIFDDLIMQKDKNKRTVLQLAAWSGYGKICETIMKAATQNKDTLTNLLTNEEQTALHLAAWNGRGEVCNVILKNVKEYPDIIANLLSKGDESHQTALHIAAWNGYDEVCDIITKTMREHPFIIKDLLTQPGVNKRTALHLAAFNGHAHICEAILKFAKENDIVKDVITKYDENGQTLLHLAARNSHSKVYELLMKTIAEYPEITTELVTKTDKTNRTVLNLAARNGKIHICHVIIDTIKDNPEVVKDILTKCDRTLHTPLHRAAWFGRDQVCELILKYAKQYNLIEDLLMKTDQNGRTAMDLARDHRHRKACDIILQSARDYSDVFNALKEGDDIL